MHQKKNSTSWQGAGNWYNNLVGEKGHYYHQHVILPNVKKLFDIPPESSLLDIGCGQGVFARNLHPSISYVGIDLAKNLIASAKQFDKNPRHEYIVADATKPLPVEKEFSHAIALLSLQNMENQEAAITNVSKLLKKNGVFLLVLNHPCFRIPRQSGWGVSDNKQQYRYINRYQTPLKVPITMHPGERNSQVTWSFHFPLSLYSQFLKKAGLIIDVMDEWVSDKESVGKASKMENRARSEIPLFLAIVARKL